MKKSLIIRWAIIAVVLVIWTLAMLPLKDKDYLQTFKKLSEPNVVKLEAGRKALLEKGNPEEIAERLQAITDKESPEYKALSEKLATLRSDANFDAWRKARDYDELVARLTLINLKSRYEMAEFIKAQVAAAPSQSEKQTLQDQYAAIVEAADYKAWTATDEYKELVRRMPAVRLRSALEQSFDKTTPEAKKMQEQLAALEAKLAERPKFADKKAEAAYDLMLARLSLVYDVDKAISGFKALEKAGNGNSECYRLNLNDFVKITFFGKASNKMILRRVRTAGAAKLHLGLDLQGGTEFVLDFDIREAQGNIVTPKVLQTFVVSTLDGNEEIAKAMPVDLLKRIREQADAQKKADAGLTSNDIARAILRNEALAADVRAFLSANLRLVHADENYISVIDIRDRILNILDNRLNSLGVTEPEIKATGDNTISVTMPSVDEADKNEIRNTIRRAARLEFFLVAANDDELVQAYEADRQGFKTPAGLIRSEIENERSDGSVIYTPVFLEAIPTPVKGEDIERAVATTDEYGRYAISLKFNASGTIAFREVTGKNVGRRLAIVLDGKVYSAPVLKQAIENGAAEITGSFTLEEAKRLASVIASGNVPVTVNIGSEFGTDPTLGSDSVRAGVRAALIGLALVVLFMLYYYRFAGLVAVIALAVNTLLVLGSMAIFKATITMPGIAGMILTIGMAVDANVIIFERIREELENKVNIVNAIKAGYGKAFSAIFDSNITTLLTAFFLFRYGAGAVKGFAVTLGLGVLASMFTAIFMTRAIFDFMIHNDAVKTLGMSTLFRFNKRTYDFLSARKALIGISVAFCILAVVVFGTRGAGMLGIDFSGGTQLSYECSGDRPDVDKIREFLKGESYSDNVRVGYKSGQSGSPLLVIVLPAVKQNGVEKQIDYTSFSERLDKRFPEVKISLRQTNTVGANVGSQFKWAAFLAVVCSSIGIIMYLAFRFEFRYGVAALIAVLHDVLVSTGLYMLCGGTLSLTVVAAILTIMGYSLNDTIVIFDRVRELRNSDRDAAYSSIINSAVSNCLSRTILTSLTTALVVVALLVLGGGAVFDFALVMFFGILTGTYSSNFIAPAIINGWHKRSLRQERNEARAKRVE